MVTSDPRFFRYEGFKGYLSVYDHFRAECPSSYGDGMSSVSLKKTIEQSTYSSSLKNNTARYYFGRIFDESAVIKHIENTVADIASKLKK